MPSTYPGFVDTDLANLTTMANVTDHATGLSYLLLKPIGKLNHGGGVQIQKDGPEYQALQGLVKRLQSGTDSCTDTPNTQISEIKTMDGASTLRKAALDIAGRLPTKAETDAVTKGGDTALDGVLENMMKEDIFSTRLQEIWNDLLPDRQQVPVATTMRLTS